MNRYMLATLGLCAFGACSLPSLDDIDLATCLKKASAVRKVCTLDAELMLDDCQDVVCAKQFLETEQQCWSDYADSANGCIAEVEEKLKE